MDVRRVVTGHDADGKAVFVSDEAVAPIVPSLLPGNEFHRLWGGDATPHFPDDGAAPGRPRLLPAGRRLPVRASSRSRPTAAPARRPTSTSRRPWPSSRRSSPGWPATWSPPTPACTPPPRSTSRSCCRAPSTLELDDGAKVTLGVGDTVVQNGTRHRWSNAGTEPAVLAVFICGAHHDRVG